MTDSKAGKMKISDWLDEQEAEGVDLTRIALPEDILYDEIPAETVFFEEIKPCGMFCTRNHPFSSVERFGHWYYCRGRGRDAGIHTSKEEWTFFTKDRAFAVRTAQENLE